MKIFLVCILASCFQIDVRAETRAIAGDLPDEHQVGHPYPAQVPEFELLIDAGAAPASVLEVPEAISKEPRLAVMLNSGKYKEASIYVVKDNASHVERYGQIAVQLGRPLPESSLFGIALLGKNLLDQKYLSLSLDQADRFNINGGLRPEDIPGFVFPSDRLSVITVNYDTKSAVFDVWVDDEKVIENQSMVTDASGTGIQPAALAFFGSYMQPPDGGSFVTEWRWSASEEPFEKPFGPKKP